MQRTSLSFLLLLALAGCASTEYAGHASFDVHRDTAGKCSITMKDGKEYAARSVAFNGETCTVVVQEGESKAFKGQAIGAKAQAVFPVTDLANILVGK